MMRIETLTCVYNEEFLLPFYLKHYSWVDRINILFDTASSDNSLVILKKASRKRDIRIIPMHMPYGMDNIIKMDSINLAYKFIDADILLNVDADEFMLTNRKDLKSIDSPITSVIFGTVYRHITEKDLDLEKSVMDQRRYGILGGAKPLIAKGKPDVLWSVGNHESSIIPGPYTGILLAHWCMADPCFCIDRRILNRVPRYSERNKSMGFSSHVSNCTREDLEEQCRIHEGDERMW